MAPDLVIDAARCPLCQQANRCAMEIEKTSGIAQAACWCTQGRIDAAVLDQIPPESRGLACICQNCANPVSNVEFGIPPIYPKDNHANLPH